MKKLLLISVCLIFSLLFAATRATCQADQQQLPKNKTEQAKPDTILTGMYLTSIHNIDFRQNQYDIIFWVWLEYKDSSYDFDKNFEIPFSKDFRKTYVNLDMEYDTLFDKNGNIRHIDSIYHLLMKIEATMKDNWQIANFPFDRQTLNMTIENAKFDNTDKNYVFKVDTVGQHYGQRFSIASWNIDKLILADSARKYQTYFGENKKKVLEKNKNKPAVSVYPNFRMRLLISRDYFSLFIKMFLGMYIAFLISYLCFFIHIDNTDSRFQLSVGSLFAAIGNQYLINSSLPESTSFTLVDKLHLITMFSILVVVASSAYSLHLFKRNEPQKAWRFNVRMAKIVMGVYLSLNLFFIIRAWLQG
jgi:hypothetical protein